MPESHEPADFLAPSVRWVPLLLIAACAIFILGLIFLVTFVCNLLGWPEPWWFVQ